MQSNAYGTMQGSESDGSDDYSYSSETPDTSIRSREVDGHDLDDMLLEASPYVASKTEKTSEATGVHATPRRFAPQALFVIHSVRCFVVIANSLKMFFIAAIRTTLTTAR